MPETRTTSPEATIRAAERSGLTVAFGVRVVATAVVVLPVLLFIPWPRNLYYSSFAFAFLLFGYIPFLLRQHRHADAIKFGFVVLDVILITAAVLNLPLNSISIDWPPQTRVRSSNFMFLLLLLGEAALTYSARRVAWTGAVIAVIWSLGFAFIYLLPDSKGIAEMGLQTTDQERLAVYLSGTYVSTPQLATQVVTTMFLTILIAAAVYRSRRHLMAQVQAERQRTDLSRYVSPDVADAITHRLTPDFGVPTNRNVAVLFADIVGFTRLNERLTPDRTFALLQSFQERSTRVVFRHRGTLDKFLGDGFMAVFGSLQEEKDVAGRAIACAFALLAEVRRWNAKREARDAERLAIVIGLHFGPVVVGSLGPDNRREFTVVGDVVNVASRLEEATRELGCSLVVSDACVAAALLDGQTFPFEQTVELTLRGHAAPLAVHVAGRQPEG